MRGVECLEILYDRLHCKRWSDAELGSRRIQWKLCRTEPAPEMYKKPRCAEAVESFVKRVFGIGDVCTSAVGTWCEGARSRVHVSGKALLRNYVDSRALLCKRRDCRADLSDTTVSCQNTHYVLYIRSNMMTLPRGADA